MYDAFTRAQKYLQSIFKSGIDYVELWATTSVCQAIGYSYDLAPQSEVVDIVDHYNELTTNKTLQESTIFSTGVLCAMCVVTMSRASGVYPHRVCV